MTDTKPIKLSKRQRQMMVFIDKGMTNKAIAEELDVSEHTVKVHMWRMYRLLDLKNRMEAARWWRDNQPQNLVHALRAAFDAACRLSDQLKVDGGLVDPGEFEHHRAQIMQLQGFKP
jgi:DNA-binding CsgD family transcriptional regulator